MDTSNIVTLIIFFLPLVLLMVSYVRNKKVRKVFEEQISEANLQISSIKNEKDALFKKYAPVIDMELHTSQLLDEATEKATSIKLQAEIVFSETETLRKDARDKLNEVKEQTEIIKNDAREEARKVIGFAEARAKEISGDAYEAKAKADSYEKAIRAMRNTIDGYKDDYIIPNQSVLDDLAEEFSYKEAGEELKAARKRVKAMVKDGHAGTCDYVEAHRKSYAIHFAVDAFNGKVDSALSKTKHDNFGKIQQEITDAFALVNHNGSPFRNARINQEYLEARLTELKWAVAAFELRKIEKEEQAEIKAQIREEERAIREMEKARKEAEKEEKMLQKALDKARAELGQASEEQKAEFEAQLAELEGKLLEAEEKGQRAISMAQQTRRGHVYVISNIGSFGKEVFKIGMTRRLEPMDRVKELGDASVPFSFDVHAMIYSDDAPALEKELHRKFNEQSVNKINPRKEFFKTTIAEVKQAVEQQGLDQVHWTLKAEATEFRESLAIEREQQTAA
ncbi:ATPase [Vibrio breoganii]|uniref:DUF4041 domain-containing protein n=1 Tax=Vibrio breoganii TaxID=553239 RepID=UPI000C836CBC|nr:DUF4041 domain-containing protein [Vibrio breoganii]PMM82717.1 ATPase [Vibrio breoganii]